ncbi:MarR family transcriptional regulator [Streptomyces sp. A0958]|uniref:MarR family transcriptional regulator n=1 Tax=Streptomyces sp. A0958 TaxID=2563101 RepID=UPI00109E6E45|nr:MarR family transcriptional regulator [Streptomyces sp. A0958]THA71096.1 MarR family transcriptional regulator [Streptomyces sp. A0958]
MPHRTGLPHRPEQVSEDVCAASELLEVLWGRGQEAAALGVVSPSQLRALLVIEQQEGSNLRSLGKALGSRAPSVSRLCDRMEAMGLIQRAPSPTSRREVELRLTRRGRELLEEYRAIRTRELTAVLERMQPSEVAALAVGLTAFRSAASQRLTGDRSPAARLRDDVADSA